MILGGHNRPCGEDLPDFRAQGKQDVPCRHPSGAKWAEPGLIQVMKPLPRLPPAPPQEVSVHFWNSQCCDPKRSLPCAPAASRAMSSQQAVFTAAHVGERRVIVTLQSKTEWGKVSNSADTLRKKKCSLLGSGLIHSNITPLGPWPRSLAPLCAPHKQPCPFLYGEINSDGG